MSHHSFFDHNYLSVSSLTLTYQHLSWSCSVLVARKHHQSTPTLLIILQQWYPWWMSQLTMKNFDSMQRVDMSYNQDFSRRRGLSKDRIINLYEWLVWHTLLLLHLGMKLDWHWARIYRCSNDGIHSHECYYCRMWVY